MQAEGNWTFWTYNYLMFVIKCGEWFDFSPEERKCKLHSITQVLDTCVHLLQLPRLSYIIAHWEKTTRSSSRLLFPNRSALCQLPQPSLKKIAFFNPAVPGATIMYLLVDIWTSLVILHNWNISYEVKECRKYRKMLSVETSAPHCSTDDQVTPQLKAQEML